MIDDLDISLSGEYHKIENKKRQILRSNRPPPSDISLSSYRSVSPLVSPKNNPNPMSINNQEYFRQIEGLSLQNQKLAAQTNQLQSYIQQLVAYINDSSSKYSDNIQKYGIAYKQLYIKLTNLEESSDHEILLLKNELTSERQTSFKREQQANEASKLNRNLKEEIEIQEQKNKKIKQESEQQWQEHQNNKNLWNTVLNGVEEQTKRFKQQLFDLNNQIKTKNRQISQHLSQIAKLNGEIQKRQALPQKIINKQKQILTKDLDMKHDKSKIQELSRTIDVLKLQLSRSEKQREQFRMKNAELSLDFENYFKAKSKTLEQGWKQKQFKYQLQISKLMQQLQSSNRSLNQQLKQASSLKDSIESKERQIASLSKRVKNEIVEKDSYLDEFKILKNNYQQAINNLQTNIEELQHKLWAVSDRNKELQFEVDKFRDVTDHLEHLNNHNRGQTQLFRDEVEMKGLGDPVRLLRGEEDKKESEKVVESKIKSFKQSRKSEEEGNDPWANLMGKINSL